MTKDHVILLGAGFSKHLADLPLTDELGKRAVGRAGIAPLPAGWSFEAWLSRLAEDQPDLSEADNLANRSQFVVLADAIAEELVAYEPRAFAAPAPEW